MTALSIMRAIDKRHPFFLNVFQPRRQQEAPTAGFFKPLQTDYIFSWKGIKR
jgi:hypothetical protein